MLLIPAIDLKEGKCVRLRQGRMEDATIFSDNPVDMANRWVEAGARRLHIVDLDGAQSGRPRNVKVIERIVARHPGVPIQVGGGIRDEETIQSYLESGVRYAILGTTAVTEPHFLADVCAEFRGHIIVGLDVRDGKLAVDGWSKLLHHDVLDLAQRVEEDGAEAIIHTDIQRDGMLDGVNVGATVDLARSVNIPVIASGGIRNLDDIRALCAVADEGIVGAVIGRAIYEGTLDFTQAQQLADDLGAAPPE